MALTDPTFTDNSHRVTEGKCKQQVGFRANNQCLNILNYPVVQKNTSILIFG